jgi:hypothetical protein
MRSSQRRYSREATAMVVFWLGSWMVTVAYLGFSVFGS